MYSVGDRIVYPMHGAGIIEDIQEKCILNEKRRYYVLSAPFGDMKLMVPVENSEDIGLRGICGEEVLEPLKETLQAPGEEMPGNWNRRSRENLEKLKSGDLCQVATVYRNLCRAELNKKLSAGEKEMMTKARHILFSELVLITGQSREEAEEEAAALIFGPEK